MDNRVAERPFEIAQDFQDAFYNVVEKFFAYLPEIIAAIVILVLGWIIGSILGKIVARIISSFKIDNALRETQLDETLAKGGMKLDTGKFVGGIVKFLIIIAAFITALGLLGLDAVNNFLEEVLLYIPNIIVAVLVLIVAAVIGDFLKKVIVASTKIASIGVSSHMLGSIAKWAVWVFGLFVALNQLGIGDELIQDLFTAIVAGAALAFGLAFGLGGREHASKALDRLSSQVRGTHHR
jgi:small-conductance mechanosensitive channel